VLSRIFEKPGVDPSLRWGDGLWGLAGFTVTYRFESNERTCINLNRVQFPAACGGAVWQYRQIYHALDCNGLTRASHKEIREIA